jgi:hypothetical protein
MSSTTDYGRDISCTDVIRTGRYVTGSKLVAEAAYRRLTTPRGMLRGGELEADYGIDLTELIGSAATKSDAAALSGRIQSELSKDERIAAVSVDVVASTSGPSTSFTITISASTSDGPFTLVLGASAVTVEILGIKADS